MTLIPAAASFIPKYLHWLYQQQVIKVRYEGLFSVRTDAPYRWHWRSIL